MFFLAVSMVGTDFTMICQLFPHRARSEIKVSKDKSFNRTRGSILVRDNKSFNLCFRTNLKKRNGRIPGGLTKLSVRRSK